MSKKISAEKQKKISEMFVDEIVNESKNIVRNIIQKGYKINKNKLEDMVEQINKLTLATMTERYTVGQIIPSELGIMETKHNDYYNWVFSSFQIPFYQSLGDTIGYYNGNWEFNYGNPNAGPDYTNELIYEFISFGGINDISIKNWLASDDTILYFETFKVVFDTYIRTIDTDSDGFVLSVKEKKIDIDLYGQNLKKAYLSVKSLISNRHPGKVTMYSLDILSNAKWDSIQYNSQAIGNGSAMRAGSIGIFFPGKHNREKLVMLAVECSRITHNSGIAILGCVVAALFTAYSIEKVNVELWPHKMLKLLKSDIVDNYMRKSRPNDFSRYEQDKILFVGKWDSYVTFRFNGTKPRTDLRFMINPVERYRYLVEKFSKGCDFPGGCADDCVIMAYDSLLQAGSSYEKLVVYSMLNPGDSDTVGSVASSWYGGIYNYFRNQIAVTSKFLDLEYFDKIDNYLEDKYDKMFLIYYRDIYLNIARKHIGRMLSSK